MFRRKSNEADTDPQTERDTGSRSGVHGGTGEAPRREDAAPAPAREPARKETKEVFTIIYRGTTVSGDIHAEGRVRVYGTVRGNVHVDGTLEVAESGYVEGDTIEVQVIKVIGRVRGNVIADGKVEIWKGGVLEGDVKAAALDIEEGAAFTGRSEMRTPAALPETAATVRGERARSASAAPDDGPAAEPSASRGDGEASQEMAEMAAATADGSDDGFGEAFAEDATARK